MQIWFFVSPIVYSTSIVPEEIGPIYQLNPMTGVIQGFRWAITGTGQPSSETLIASVAVGLVLLVSGIYYFRRMERTFADVV
jgi:lipopolysaccharide transport system permease protein